MSKSLPELNQSELVRYSRHIMLENVGLEGQRRLSAARVLVIGAGGLGSPVSLYLAAAGIGTLGLVDFDRVEAHNLQRQILHETSGIGRLKTESGLDRLSAINPHIKVVPHAERISAANAMALFENYDVIVDGTDNFPTRYLNNDAAVLARKPLVYGSIFKFEGQVSVFDPVKGAPCYRCLFPTPPPPGSVPSCGEAGVIGAICGVIGSMQALEAIKIILGIGKPLHGRLIAYDALNQTFRTLNLKRDPACPVCGANPTIRTLESANYEFSCQTPVSEKTAVVIPAEAPLETDVLDASRQLQKVGGAVLLDVREPYEFAICQVAGSLQIPMRQIPDRLSELPRDRPILVLCHHGGRSRRVTEFLRSNGFDSATNIAGGIDAWACEIDPSLARY